MEINALEKIYNHFKKTNANVIQFNYIEFDEQKFNVLEKAHRKYMLATIRHHYNAIQKIQDSKEKQYWGTKIKLDILNQK